MISLNNSGLQTENFGVFGSMLHGFHHRKYSDIDLIVYGKNENAKMRETLAALYADEQFGFRNEFQSDKAMDKDWRFQNFTVPNFIWHQRRKQIYRLIDNRPVQRQNNQSRVEPVKLGAK